MRKLSLFVCSGLVLLGMFGLQAQVASATEPEPDCAGQSAGIRGFHVGTDPGKGGGSQVASVYGGAALCGSDLDWLGNLNKGYKEGYIVTPGKNATGGGVTMRCANPNGLAGHTAYCSGTDLAVGSYAGSSGIDLIDCTLGTKAGCFFQQDAFITNRIDTNGIYTNTKCDDRVTIVGCYESKDSLGFIGHMDITVEVCTANSTCAGYDPGNVKYLMHIYQVSAIWPVDAVYYTEIGEPKFNHTTEPDPRDYEQCKYAGLPSESACSSTDNGNWIQKNSPAGTYKCSGTPALLEGSGVRAMTFSMAKQYYDACSQVIW